MTPAAVEREEASKRRGGDGAGAGAAVGERVV
jgi:hypothetical protein